MLDMSMPSDSTSPATASVSELGRVPRLDRAVRLGLELKAMKREQRNAKLDVADMNVAYWTNQDQRGHECERETQLQASPSVLPRTSFRVKRRTRTS